MTPTRRQSSLSTASLSKKLSLVVILIGVVVILGWEFNIPPLKGLVLGLPTMKVNTALCFILAGIALRGWHQPFKIQNSRLRIGISFLTFNCAFLIVLIASLTLIQYGFNLNVGIDQLLMQQPEPIGSTAAPGRMAPNTAVTFLSVGSALLLMNSRRFAVGMAQGMAVAAWLLSFVGLLGHVYGSVYFYTVGSYTGMAIHTAIAFQLLSIGILCAVPDRGLMSLLTSSGVGSLMMRRLLPMAIAAPVLMGALISFGFRLHFYGQEVETALDSTLNILIFVGLVSWNAQLLNRTDLKRRQTEQNLQQANANLERQVEERTLHLRTSEQRLRSVLEHMPVMLDAFDDAWNIIVWNQECEQVTGYQASEVIKNSTIMERFYPDAAYREQMTTAWAEQGNNYRNWEWDITCKDGSTRTVSWSNLSQRFPIPGWAAWGIGVDVTDRKQAEESLNRLNRELENQVAERTSELQQMNDRLQHELCQREQAERQLQQTLMLQNAILNSANYSIISTTVDGTINSFNAGAEKLLGYSTAEVVGKLTPTIIHDPQEVAARAQRLSQELEVAIEPGFEVFVAKAKRGEIEECEWSYLRKDGSRVPVLLSVTALRDRNGNLTGFLGIGSDISDRKASEEAVRRSEATLRSFFDSSSMQMGIVELHDTDILHISDNPTAAKFFGTTIEAMQNQFASAMGVPRPHLEFWLNHYQEAKRTQAPIRFEYSHQTSSGQKCLSATVCSIATPADQRPRFSYIVEDISDRKRIEAERQQVENAFRKSEARFQAFMNFSPTLKWITNQDGQLFYVNKTYCQVFQTSAGAVIGQSISELFPAEMAQEHLKNIRHVAETNQVIEAIESAPRPDGTLGIFQVYKFPIPDTSEQSLVGGIAIDITQQHQAEVALQKSEERLQLALEASGEGLWDWETGAKGYLSPLYQEMLGYEPGELVIDLQIWEDMIHPDDRSWVLDRLTTHLQDSSVPYTFDYRLRTKSGEWKWIANYGKVVARDEQGNSVRMIGMHKDISDRKRIELELQQAKEAAELANDSKSIFLANMSHELRTPLNVILGFAQVLRRDSSLSSDHQETIQTIHRSGEHLLSLINNILDLSKIEADRTSIEASNFDLFEILRSLENMLCHRAAAKNLQFRFEIAPDVPQFATTDINKLRQILINLLSNAIKFTEQGHVILRVAVEPESVDDSPSTPYPSTPSPHPPITLLFAIEDTGVGIADDEIQHVFDAFVQSRSGKLATGGTGLGLTISRRFARLLNGDISATSRLGQGSTFCFRLPVQIAEAASVPVASQRQLIGLVPGQPTSRILIVDDQPENRSLLTLLMTQLGMDIREASNGQEAITVWQQWQPHLIWMDIRIPELNGYEATQQIRALPNGQSPIIIALTAQASMGDRTLALAAGCNDFVAKPFNENLLYDKMTEYLNLQFIYAENLQLSDFDRSTTQNTATALTAESLSVMPAEWLTALYSAAQICDEEEIERLLQQIPTSHAPLAHQLRQLTHDYQFGQIKHLLRENSNCNC